jgi:hypothetical protein
MRHIVSLALRVLRHMMQFNNHVQRVSSCLNWFTDERWCAALHKHGLCATFVKNFLSLQQHQKHLALQNYKLSKLKVSDRLIQENEAKTNLRKIELSSNTATQSLISNAGFESILFAFVGAGQGEEEDFVKSSVYKAKQTF